MHVVDDSVAPALLIAQKSGQSFHIMIRRENEYKGARIVVYSRFDQLGKQQKTLNVSS